MDKIYLARFSEAEKKTILRRIKRENTVLYPRLEIVDFRLPPVTKRPDTLNRIKRYFTVILSVTFTRIYDDILDKRVTEGSFFKLTRL